MTAAPDRERDAQRDAQRSRTAILDAAERLFAERGFDATSLQDVGAAAGVSRGTPGYFFGSKAALHRAVLERAYAKIRDAVRSGRARALASGEAPEVVLAGAVGEYFDFITAHPRFVRLLEWEALEGGRTLEALPPHAAALREALEAMRDELGLADDPEAGAQLLLSILGLCWFPLVHSATMLGALGLEPADPAFLERRRAHVVDLVVRGFRGRFPASRSPGDAPDAASRPRRPASARSARR